MSTTTRTRKIAKVATITHDERGTVLSGAPYIVPGYGQLANMLNVKRNADALGWTWDRAGKVWIMDGSAGEATPDLARVTECVAALATIGVNVDAKATGTRAKAAAKAAKAAPAKAPAKAAPAKAAPAKAAGSTDLAEIIATALDGMPVEIIAAAIMAATAQANALAKAAPAKAAKAAKAAAKAAPAKATGKVVKITMDDDGGRRYALAPGTAVKAAAKAARVAIAADKRSGGACVGAEWHVMADRSGRAIIVHRVSDDDAPASAPVDALIRAAIA